MWTNSWGGQPCDHCKSNARGMVYPRIVGNSRQWQWQSLSSKLWASVSAFQGRQDVCQSTYASWANETVLHNHKYHTVFPTCRRRLAAGYSGTFSIASKSWTKWSMVALVSPASTCFGVDHFLRRVLQRKLESSRACLMSPAPSTAWLTSAPELLGKGAALCIMRTIRALVIRTTFELSGRWYVRRLRLEIGSFHSAETKSSMTITLCWG